MTKSKLFILAVAIVLVAAACNKSSNSTSTTGSSDTSSISQTPTPSPTPALADTPTPTPAPSQTPAAVTISMTASGFSPANITVKSGTKVTFVNNDTKPHWPASNPHPVHTDLPGFDALQNVAPGGSYSFTFTKVGTWGYHDHLAPSLGGKIIVTQ